MAFRFLRLLPLVLFAACSHHHPLDGTWNQELAGGAKGMHIEFDVKSDNVEVGTAPRPDGTHDHKHGKYTFDAATKAITVKVKLGDDGKEETWTGKLDGQHLELTAADGKPLKFAHSDHDEDD